MAWIARLGGWRAAIALSLVFLVMKLGPFAIGEDTGGFLWVMAHFIVTPVMSSVVLAATLLRVYLTDGRRARLVVASSAIAPLSLIYLVISVGTWLKVTRSLSLSLQ